MSESTRNMDLPTAVAVAKQAAPGIDAATAISVAQSGGDIEGKAQVVSHVAQQNARLEAMGAASADAGHKSTNVLTDALGWLGHNVVHPIQKAVDDIPGAQNVAKGVADISQELNKPLGVVMHEYRYLHDVEARHGMTAAVTEGVAIAAGAIGGGITAGPDGAILGGEGAAFIMGHVMYPDSWGRTADGATYRDPHTHLAVSFGRDIASHLVPLKSGTWGTISGVIDGITDMAVDPLGAGGKIAGQMKSVEGAKGLLAKRWGGTSINPENIDDAYRTYGTFRRAVDQISTHDAGWIGSHFPKMLPIAHDLGDADTHEAVLDVFKDAAKTQELMVNQLPSQTFVRQGFQTARDAVANSAPTLSYSDGTVSDLANHSLAGAAANHLSWLSPAAMTRRFSKTTGASFDTLAKEFTSKKLDPFNRADGQDLYRLVRYSQDERTAQWVLNHWIYATPSERIILARNTYMDVVAHIAHFHPIVDEEGDVTGYWHRKGLLGTYEHLDTEEVRERLKERLDELTGGSDAGLHGVYGMDLGQPIQPTWDPQRKIEVQGAVTLKQTGKIGVPTFTQVKRMGAELRGAKALTGKLDDFAYDAITQKFFKPLVLLSISYAEHIALAEMIPNALRVGVHQLVRGTYHSVSARLGYAVDDREVDGLKGYMMRFMRAADERTMARIQDPFWREVATIVALKTDGHMVTRGLSAGENYSAEINSGTRFTEALRQAMVTRENLRGGNEFGAFALTDMKGRNKYNQYLHYWQSWFREVATDPPSRRAAVEYLNATKRGWGEERAMRQAKMGALSELNKLKPAEADGYIRNRLISSREPPPGLTPREDWAGNVAANMRSVIGAKDMDEAARTRLLAAMVKGETPKARELGAWVPQDSWPEAVKGRIQVPNSNGTISQIANVGFKGVINPIVNFLSREPLMMEESVKQWRVLKPMVDSGVYSYDQAANLMMSRATVETIKWVHNLHDRSQFSETARNWMPFFFAQEQAYRRMGRLLASDPGAFRRYQMMITGVAQANAKLQANGNQGYFAIPGGTYLASGSLQIMKGLGLNPVNVDVAGFSASLSSANVIFPLSSGFRPDLSPVAALSARSLYALFPELGPALSKLVTPQTLSNPLWKLVLPNTFLQRMVVVAAADHDRSFASAMIQTIQLMAYEQEIAYAAWEKGGRKGPPPDIVPSDNDYIGKQNFLNRIRNQTRVLYTVNAVLGFNIPISPSVSIKDFGFKAEVSKDIAKEGSVSAGVQAFLLKHPDANAYTVWQSQGVSPLGPDFPGASLPSNDGGEKWINDNQSFIHANPAVAFYMMPPSSGPYDPVVYDEQLAQGYRVKRSPQQFLDQLYVAAGNQLYYAALAHHEAIINNTGVSAADKNSEYTNFDQFITQLQSAYPTWAAKGPLNKGAAEATMTQSILELRKMAATGTAPKNPQADAMMSILPVFEQFNDAYVEAGNRTYSTALKEQKAIKTQWQDKMLAVGKAVPALKEAVDAVYLNGLGNVEVNSNG